MSRDLPSIHLPRTSAPQQRSVFRGRRRRPPRWRQVLVGLALGLLGAGLLVGLLQLPSRFDTVLLVSTAIANLIAGLGRFLLGLLQLVALGLVLAVAVAGLLLLVMAVLRIVRAFLPLPRRPG
ncbi:hypothetical protein [Synechococcus sp. CS-1328]|uniref:hypothetical protein n=1 Tax=Synechococcus sp. CS-1328 TaxID=2847976 RepID=UPI00223B6BAF|nr:hypothetical protein [Synechococcus sp. CS-1328]MCT0226116.1 hypothetical protein [Synechococcus sp. CS-1328]